MIFQIAVLENGLINFLYMLESFGMSEIILPFLLIFTVSFAALEKSGVFRSRHDETQPGHLFHSSGRKLSMVTALAISGMAVFAHLTGQSYDIIPIINKVLPTTIATMIALVIGLTIISVFFRGEMNIANWGIFGILMVILVIFVFYQFATAAGWRFPSWIITSGVLQIIVGIIFVTFLVNLLTSSATETGRKSNRANTQEWRNWMFGGHGGGNHENP